MPPRTTSPSDLHPSPALARSASLLSLGAIASRLLGLVRDMVIAGYFGASGLVSAFAVASSVPTMLYDFLVGGMLSAALVPVLSDYARPGRGGGEGPDRASDGRPRPSPELVRLFGALLSLASVTLAAIVLILLVFAPQVAGVLAGGFDRFDPALLPLTTRLVRLIAPVVWFFSMAGLLTAVLYSLQRFSLPAIATAVYNLGIVVAAPLLAGRIGIASLAVGVLAGGIVQFGLMAWDVRRAGLRFSVQWSHPALGRIVRLYLPIAAGLVVAQFQVGLDRRLASGTGVESIAWMRNATTLQQLPLGIVSVAIALAALPRLSQLFAEGDEGGYRRTLGEGMRMVLVLIVPVLVGLWLLAEPTVRLLFERGAFTAADTAQVVRALRVYLFGALFAAIDFPLNYAFYARNNTLLPALVGVLSVLVYGVVALALVEGRGFLGLVWADTAKQAAHALVMLAFLAWTIRAIPRQVLGEKDDMGRIHTLRRVLGPTASTLLSITVAAGAMAAVAVALLSFLSSSGTPTLASDLLALCVAGGSGALVYAGGLLLAGQPEARRLWQVAQKSLRSKGVNS